MAEPFAAPSDVEARWRTLTSAETDVAETLLFDASSMVRERWGDIDARILTDSISVDTVVRVVANMVKRAMLVGDAEGLASQQQAAGPFSVNSTFANPNGNLYFTAAEVQLLDGLGYVPRSRVGWLA